MIDYESCIYNDIVTLLRTSYPNINAQSVLTLTPSVFPTVCIEEVDNTTTYGTSDSSHTEKYADVMYEVNVYTQLPNTSKTQAKSILSIIDSALISKNFTCTAKMGTPYNNGYRMMARYVATIDANGNIYNRR